MSNKSFNRWFTSQRKKQKKSIKTKNLNKLINWHKNKNHIAHNSSKFFKIIAIDVKSNMIGNNWDQPIIVQNEMGILGILKDSKKINIYYKLKSKQVIEINYNYHLQFKQQKAIIKEFTVVKKFLT